MCSINDYLIEKDDAYLIINSKTLGEHKVRIDLEDVHRISLMQWHVQCNGHKIYVRGSNTKRQLLSRFILSAPPHLVVDHISSDTLDNRKSNLRLVTKKENSQNRKPNRKNGTGVRGVMYREGRKRPWIAHSSLDGKSINIGSYYTLDEAAAASAAFRAKYMKGTIETLDLSQSDVANADKALDHNKPRVDTRSGVKGVLWVTSKQCWLVCIKRRHTIIINKLYKRLEDAAAKAEEIYSMLSKEE